MDVFNRYLVVTLSAATLFFSTCTFAEDDYLLMLEAETENLRLDQGGQRGSENKRRKQQLIVNEKKWLGECSFTEDVLILDVPREAFSSYLKQCSLSLFVYYRRLDAGSQTLVFEKYQNASPVRFSSLKKTIVNYL
jgi:hypothetical protein